MKATLFTRQFQLGPCPGRAEMSTSWLEVAIPLSSLSRVRAAGRTVLVSLEAAETAHISGNYRLTSSRSILVADADARSGLSLAGRRRPGQTRAERRESKEEMSALRHRSASSYAPPKITAGITRVAFRDDNSESKPRSSPPPVHFWRRKLKETKENRLESRKRLVEENSRGDERLVAVGDKLSVCGHFSARSDSSSSIRQIDPREIDPRFSVLIFLAAAAAAPPRRNPPQNGAQDPVHEIQR